MSVQSKGDPLSRRRKSIETLKEAFLTGRSSEPAIIPPILASSWRKCASNSQLKLAQDAAPLDDPDEARMKWEASPLRRASLPEQGYISQLAREGVLVANIANAQGQILWTCVNPSQRNLTERFHVTPGGKWDEHSSGTNGISLALDSQRPVTVFAGEHYLPSLAELVCYSAPIINPQSGEVYGVVSLSSHWKQHTSAGNIVITAIAQDIAQRLPQPSYKAELEIHVLGKPMVYFRGKLLHLTPRLIEILCILALYPAGLTLEACHAALYGDGHVSLTTLKTELSHLRNLLNGQLGSRPYRLLGTVWADFHELWEAIRERRLDDAISLHRGELLPNSTSPEIGEWRNCIAAVMKNLCPCPAC